MKVKMKMKRGMEGQGLRGYDGATESVGDIDLDKRGADVFCRALNTADTCVWHDLV